jgi:hypothetical protein
MIAFGVQRMLLVDMACKGHNISMSCGLMIPILQLGHCGFFELWKKL